MRVPLQWLSDFVSPDRSPADLASLLTFAGLEVDAIEQVGCHDPLVVTGRILSIDPHPDADRLRLCTVDDGVRTHAIVCGASNMREGDIVALALPGATLPGGRHIVPTTIRGRQSAGMLCSAEELNLGDDHEGILILDPETPLGRPLKEIHPGCDTVLEISITPNRADCLSMIGIAREVAALTGQPLRPDGALARGGRSEADSAADWAAESGEAPFEVVIEAGERCPYYCARVMRDVRVGPSSLRVAGRLMAAGLRPINNVVDATNYLMLEWGQPFHAFDLERLEGGRIVVRPAKEGERLRCLDDTERILKSDDLVIADQAKPIALGGIMGGRETAVSESTRHVLLEAAYFEPRGIRRSARRLGLHTDSSHRFERGVDGGALAANLGRLTAHMRRECAGRVDGAPICAGQAPEPPSGFQVRPDRIGRLLGMSLNVSAMISDLNRLGIGVERRGAGLWVRPPSFRRDLTQEADIAEEIGRVEGYERIADVLPRAPMQGSRVGRPRRLRWRLQEELSSVGLVQTLSYSFVGAELLRTCGLDRMEALQSFCELANPISAEFAVLRPLVVPSLLKVAALNAARGVEDIHIFEIGRVFGSVEGEQRPVESDHIGVLLIGRRGPRHWSMPEEEVDLFDLKGYLELVCETVGMAKGDVQPCSGVPFLLPGRSWRIMDEGREAGWFGTLHPRVGERLGIKSACHLFEVDPGPRWKQEDAPARFRPLPKFPSVSRDLAFVVEERVSAERLRAWIEEEGGDLLERIDLFDVYTGKGIPAGHRSLAWSLTFRAPDRTLTDEEVQRVFQRMVERLEREVGARVRA